MKQQLILFMVIVCEFIIKDGYGSTLKFGDDDNEIHKHSIWRRDTESTVRFKPDVNIGDGIDNKVDIYNYPLKEDPRIDIQLVWLGENAEVQLLLTTLEFHMAFMKFSHPSKLYQSTDRGRTFQEIQSKINNTSIRKYAGVMKSPHNNKKLILVSHTSHSLFSMFGKVQNTALIITENGGDSFSKVDLPFVMREYEPLLFHPWREDWIIALEQEKTIISSGFAKPQKFGRAWITKDFGKTWRVMLQDKVAKQVKWGTLKGKEDDIYLSTSSHGKNLFSFWSLFESNSKLTLWRSFDGGHFFDEIIEDMYNYGTKENYVFASVDFKEKDGTKSQEKRILHISSDNGENFHPVHVPEITQDMFYSVLDIYKGAIFLHRDDPGNTGKGTLYISGADGLIYTKSLENHFHTDSGFHDFYRVESMAGVYITQVLAKDSTLLTKITLNRGLSWKPLAVDEKHCTGVQGVCSLHLHVKYSSTKHVDAQGPLSSENAPGIILAHGAAGDALTGRADVWLSTDGGYNWKMIAVGPHHYAIGDNGNLLVLVPKFNTTGKEIKYSIDQGRNWYQSKFNPFNEDLMVLGLATEPHSKELMFSLWGHVKNSDSKFKEWTAVTVNFHKIFKKQCSSNDFEQWRPHELNGKAGCFLGEQVYYQRPKVNTKCFLGRDFNPVAKRVKCQCSKDDLECDYGYERNDNGVCKRNSEIPLLEICIHGELERELFSKGYRRSPGDICENEGSDDDVIKYIDEKKKCKPNKEDIIGVIKQEKEEIALEKSLKEKPKIVVKKNSGWKIAFIIFLILLVFGAAGLIYYKKFYNKGMFRNIPYVRHKEDSTLPDEQIVYSACKKQNEYHDETDIEDDTLLPA